MPNHDARPTDTPTTAAAQGCEQTLRMCASGDAGDLNVAGAWSNTREAANHAVQHICPNNSDRKRACSSIHSGLRRREPTMRT